MASRFQPHERGIFLNEQFSIYNDNASSHYSENHKTQEVLQYESENEEEFDDDNMLSPIQQERRQFISNNKHGKNRHILPDSISTPYDQQHNQSKKIRTDFVSPPEYDETSDYSIEACNVPRNMQSRRYAMNQTTTPLAIGVINRPIEYIPHVRFNTAIHDFPIRELKTLKGYVGWGIAKIETHTKQSQINDENQENENGLNVIGDLDATWMDSIETVCLHKGQIISFELFLETYFRINVSQRQCLFNTQNDTKSTNSFETISLRLNDIIEHTRNTEKLHNMSSVFLETRVLATIEYDIDYQRKLTQNACFAVDALDELPNQEVLPKVEFEKQGKFSNNVAFGFSDVFVKESKYYASEKRNIPRVNPSHLKMEAHIAKVYYILFFIDFLPYALYHILDLYQNKSVTNSNTENEGPKSNKTECVKTENVPFRKTIIKALKQFKLKFSTKDENQRATNTHEANYNEGNGQTSVYNLLYTIHNLILSIRTENIPTLVKSGLREDNTQWDILNHLKILLYGKDIELPDDPPYETIGSTIDNLYSDLTFYESEASEDDDENYSVPPEIPSETDEDSITQTLDPDYDSIRQTLASMCRAVLKDENGSSKETIDGLFASDTGMSKMIPYSDIEDENIIHPYNQKEQQPVFSGSKMILFDPAIRIIQQHNMDYIVMPVEEKTYLDIYRSVNSISSHSIATEKLITPIKLNYPFFWQEKKNDNATKKKGMASVILKSHVMVSPRLISAHETVRDAHIQLPKDKEFRLKPDAMSLYIQAIGHKIKLENMVSEQSVATRYDLKTVSLLLLNACRYVQRSVRDKDYI